MQELVTRLSSYSRDSVISLCSFIGILLKLWDRGSYDLARYDHLISCAFEPLRRRDCSSRMISGIPCQIVAVIKTVLLHCAAILAGMLCGRNLVVGVVPFGTGSHFIGLPRTYVRGYYMSPLRGWIGDRV
jgi:hypothetical protein